MPIHTTACVRALVLAVSLTLAAPVTILTGAAQAAPAAPRPVVRSKLAQLADLAERRASRGTVPHAAHDTANPNPRADRRPTLGRTRRGPSAVGQDPGTRPTAAPQPCAGARLGTLADRVLLNVVRVADATHLTITRTRDGGVPAVVVDTAPTGSVGSTTQFTDRRTSLAAWPTYLLTTATGTGSSTCTIGTASPGAPDGVLISAEGDLLMGSPDGSVVGLGDPTLFTDTVAFSPDGRWVAAASASTTASFDIRLQRADGLGAVTVVAGSASDDVEPAFSPDGRYLAYTRYDADGTTSLWLYNLHSGVTAQIPSSTGLGAPSWAHDSLRVVAASTVSDTANLVYVTVSTGTRTQLAGTPGSWSSDVAPDGTVAYAAEDGSTSSIRLWTPTSQRTRASVSSADELLDQPRFSPDGASLSMLDERGDGVSTPLTGIVVTGTARGTDEPNQAFGNWLDQPSLAGYDVRHLTATSTTAFSYSGADDLVVRDSSGVLKVYPNDQSAVRTISGGWTIYTAMVAVGDFDGDGIGDLMARDSAGVLWFISGNGSYGVHPRRAVGSGWNGYTIIGNGDFDGDTHTDLIARDGAGALWLYPGRGTGGVDGPAFGGRRKIGAGWTGYTIVGVDDANFDGANDLAARRPDGSLLLYPGSGSGGFGPTRSYGGGWNAYNALLGVHTAPGGVRPFVAGRVGSTGQIRAYPFLGDGSLSFAASGILTMSAVSTFGTATFVS